MSDATATDFFRKTFKAFTHVGGGRPDEEGGPVCEIDHGAPLDDF